MKYAALIPMRAGSKRLPGKHTKKLAGHAPAVRSMTAALGTVQIDGHVFVMTDDPTVVEALQEWPIVFLERSPESATDLASTSIVIMEFLARVQPDFVVLIQATNPFVTAWHITHAIAAFEKSGADSMMSVVRWKRNIYEDAPGGLLFPLNRDTAENIRLRDQKGFLMENGCFYIFRSADFLEGKDYKRGNVIPYEMPWWSCFELDEKKDEIVSEFLLQQVIEGRLPL